MKTKSQRAHIDTVTLRTLLIEDNLADAALISAQLEEAAPSIVNIQVTDSLEEAGRLLLSQVFDVILVDLSLPGSSGLESVRFVQQRAGDTAVVVLTGLTDESVARAAVQAGAQDYLVKDAVAPWSLLRSIQYAIDRKRNEAAARKLHQELAHANKLAAIGRLVTGIAHEIRNPLQIINYGANALAKLLVDPDPKAARNVKRIQEATQRASTFTNDLLDYGSPLSLKPAPRRLSPLLVLWMEEARLASEHEGVEIELSLPVDLGSVVIDEERLRQVLMNLVSNAQRQTEGDGTVDVVATPDAEGRVTIEVRDMGPGIDPDHLDSVFEPFFTTRSSGVGTGLGLAICKAIVEAHGGTIGLFNNPSGGAIARVVLPVGGPGTGDRMA
jgi:signal transduction histidine kinase